VWYPALRDRARASSGMSEFVKVFGCRPLTDVPRAWLAGVGKPPREETAGREGARFVTRYGDLSAANRARD
jgi:hypothetical protein